ncbi:MAG: DUF2007 domain-containing protein [Syntrophomonadaceae bacterium]|nr:DUF2007 domain-containing protein [Syntrophomonadaceae bacterium]
MKEKDASNSWVYLLNARDHIEVGIIESLLAEEGIPIFLKRKGSGAYMEIYMGISHAGIDLYVPAGRIDEAQNILGLEASSQLFDDGFRSASVDKKKRIGQVGINIYLAFILLGVILIVFNSIINYLRG